MPFRWFDNEGIKVLKRASDGGLLYRYKQRLTAVASVQRCQPFEGGEGYYVAHNLKTNAKMKFDDEQDACKYAEMLATLQGE